MNLFLKEAVMRLLGLFLILSSMPALASVYDDLVADFRDSESAVLEDFRENGLWRGQCVTAQYPNRVRDSAMTVEIEEDPVLGDLLAFIEQINIRNNTNDEHFYRLITGVRQAGQRFYQPLSEGPSYLGARRFRHYNEFYGDDLHEKNFYLRKGGDGVVKVFIRESGRTGTFVSVICNFTAFVGMN